MRQVKQLLRLPVVLGVLSTVSLVGGGAYAVSRGSGERPSLGSTTSTTVTAPDAAPSNDAAVTTTTAPAAPVEVTTTTTAPSAPSGVTTTAPSVHNNQPTVSPTVPGVENDNDDAEDVSGQCDGTEHADEAGDVEHADEAGDVEHADEVGDVEHGDDGSCPSPSAGTSTVTSADDHNDGDHNDGDHNDGDQSVTGGASASTSGHHGGDG